MSNKLAVCYHPTQIVIVDDNERFLQAMGLDFKKKKIFHKAFVRSLEALDFLTNTYSFNPFTKRCLLRPEERSFDHRNIDIDIRAISKEMNNPDRFLEIAVLVIDYAMPGLNGLELAEKLKNTKFKIILLTGEADEKLAIQAFNKGIIHKFIRKDMANFTEVLSNSIKELQLEYFKELSEIIIDSLAKNPEYPPSCLDDPAFINFFVEQLKMRNPIEYYLNDALGSYIFLDFEGHPSWLAIKDEDAMAGAALDAELSDKKIPATILEALQKRKKLVYLPYDEKQKKAPEEWLPYLHDIKILEGRQKYYYSFIESSNLYKSNAEKIVSYNDFLQKS